MGQKIGGQHGECNTHQGKSYALSLQGNSSISGRFQTFSWKTCISSELTHAFKGHKPWQYE